jgi:hypothetical protein
MQQIVVSLADSAEYFVASSQQRLAATFEHYKTVSPIGSS